MVTPIETKRESVRSDHRRGCYKNGMKAPCSVQIAHLASWTARSVQFSHFVGWTVGVSLSGIHCPRPPEILFRNCCETRLSSSASLYLLSFIFSFFEEDISREISDFDFVVTDFDPNRRSTGSIVKLRLHRFHSTVFVM
ncbi:hypothetical protein DY000_02053196 [Brassica cretica]|uniref:Uncharacterized protein n=1 Tax=Brassica cretica TaxID=69181 RepID=A0ABQ7A6G3_BRACR|nr:hypothetical protein DY000_02053196 [Brassica cretica]